MEGPFGYPSGLGRARRGARNVCVGTEIGGDAAKTYLVDRLVLQKQDRFRGERAKANQDRECLDVIRQRCNYPVMMSRTRAAESGWNTKQKQSRARIKQNREPMTTG